MLTLEDAQKTRCCRFCEQPIRAMGPAGWPFQFGELSWPVHVVLNFGKEFAHASCLKEAGIEVPDYPLPVTPDG